MTLRKFFGIGPVGEEEPDSSEQTDTVRKIIASLEALEPARARYLAAFAYVLGRVANADLKISPEETREMERIVLEWGHLPEEQAVLVVQIAKSQNRLFGGTENFVVTREFKEISAPAQREELLHCLFAVSAADESISTVEENEIWKIAAEIGITHSEYVAIRAAYRDKREVLKNLPSRL